MEGFNPQSLIYKDEKDEEKVIKSIRKMCSWISGGQDLSDIEYKGILFYFFLHHYPLPSLLLFSFYFCLKERSQSIRKMCSWLYGGQGLSPKVLFLSPLSPYLPSLLLLLQVIFFYLQIIFYLPIKDFIRPKKVIKVGANLLLGIWDRPNSTRVRVGLQRAAYVRKGPQGPHGSAWVRMGPHGSAWILKGPHGSARVRKGPQGSMRVHELARVRKGMRWYMGVFSTYPLFSFPSFTSTIHPIYLSSISSSLYPITLYNLHRRTPPLSPYSNSLYNEFPPNFPLTLNLSQDSWSPY
jgi:hypothetical protein